MIKLRCVALDPDRCSRSLTLRASQPPARPAENARLRDTKGREPDPSRNPRQPLIKVSLAQARASAVQEVRNAGSITYLLYR